MKMSPTTGTTRPSANSAERSSNSSGIPCPNTGSGSATESRTTSASFTAPIFGLSLSQRTIKTGQVNSRSTLDRRGSARPVAVANDQIDQFSLELQFQLDHPFEFVLKIRGLDL